MWPQQTREEVSWNEQETTGLNVHREYSTFRLNILTTIYEGLSNSYTGLLSRRSLSDKKFGINTFYTNFYISKI